MYIENQDLYDTVLPDSQALHDFFMGDDLRDEMADVVSYGLDTSTLHHAFEV